MAFLFGQLFLCVMAHRLEHGGHEDDENDDESPSHLMATHLPSLFSLNEAEEILRQQLSAVKEDLAEYDLAFSHSMSKTELKEARALRKNVDDLKSQIHEFYYNHWTVNQFSFAFSCVVFFGINGYWLFNVSQSFQSGNNMPMVPELGRNWYALSFANPSFLPLPGDERVCGGNNCPAGW